MNNARKLTLLEKALAYAEGELSRAVTAQRYPSVLEISLQLHDYSQWIEELAASPEHRAADVPDEVVF